MTKKKHSEDEGDHLAEGVDGPAEDTEGHRRNFRLDGTEEDTEGYLKER